MWHAVPRGAPVRYGDILWPSAGADTRQQVPGLWLNRVFEMQLMPAVLHQLNVTACRRYRQSHPRASSGKANEDPIDRRMQRTRTRKREGGRSANARGNASDRGAAAARCLAEGGVGRWTGQRCWCIHVVIAARKAVRKWLWCTRPVTCITFSLCVYIKCNAEANYDT